MVIEAKPIIRKTYFKSFSFFPIFYKASSKRTSMELPESISTRFTLYSLISAMITRTLSWGQVTCSISNSDKEMTTPPLPWGDYLLQLSLRS